MDELNKQFSDMTTEDQDDELLKELDSLITTEPVGIIDDSMIKDANRLDKQLANWEKQLQQP